jgi:5'-nucleotidase
MKPLALVTNDDGIHTRFLHEWVWALQTRFDVCVAAPAREQSWIGRAISRHRPVAVEAYSGFDCPAWKIDGTPSDCVNIALGHLMERQPDIVLSGINVGYNTTLPLIFCSGTVAGAMEAATWGVPALAVSQLVPQVLFHRVKEDEWNLEAPVLETLQRAAGHSVHIAEQILGLPRQRLGVFNLNYPHPLNDGTPLKWTVPADLRQGNLFDRKSEGLYEFHYRPGEEMPLPGNPLTDRVSLGRGEISMSYLNFFSVANTPASAMDGIFEDFNLNPA